MIWVAFLVQGVGCPLPKEGVGVVVGLEEEGESLGLGETWTKGLQREAWGLAQKLDHLPPVPLESRQQRAEVVEERPR